MTNFRRAGLVACLAVVALAFSVGLWYGIGSPPGLGSRSWSLELRKFLWLGNPSQLEQIRRTIAQLGSETLEQSIRNLVDDEMYSRPGYRTARKLAQTNLEEMLSSRRAIKVIDELEAIEVDERVARCRDAFATIFEEHARAFRAAIRHHLDPSAPANRQSVRATRLGLCALMFAMADLGRDDVLFEQLSQLDALRDEMERTGDREIKDPSLRAVLTNFAAPDDRFRLNMLRLAALRKDDGQGRLSLQIEAACTGLGKQVIPIVPWDAAATWFDTSGGAVDVSLGVRSFEFLDRPTSMSFDPDARRELIRKIEALLGK